MLFLELIWIAKKVMMRKTMRRLILIESVYKEEVENTVNILSKFQKVLSPELDECIQILSRVHFRTRFNMAIHY